MKIALFGATGMVGSRIAAEATARGHQVTTLSRSTGADLADADAVRAAAADHDVVVSATGPSRTGDPHEPWLDCRLHPHRQRRRRARGVRRRRRLAAHPRRHPPARHRRLPGGVHGEATSGAAALDLFRAAPESVDWTFVSPAPVIAPGERTGSYATALDTPAGDFITAEDYAVALVDEIEEPQHRRQRFTAAAA